jgi:hypothetical protein
MPWGELAKNLMLGTLTEGFFVAFGSGVTGHAVIIDVWVSAEAYLGASQVEGRFERNVEGKLECAPIRRICKCL